MTLLLTACSGGSSKSTNSIYGDLPEIIEKTENELKKEVRSMKEKGNMDFETALGMIVLLKQKVEENTAESRAKLVGKTLPYELSDSLPYTIASDITITEVNFTSRGDFLMKAEFDIEITDSLELSTLGKGLNIYYLLTGEAGPLYLKNNYCNMKDVKITQKPDGYGGTWPYWTLAPGDKLHTKISFTADDTQVMSLCERLKFIPEKRAKEARNEATNNLKRVLEPTPEK